MKIVEIQYYVTFGKGDSSEWLEYEIKLTDTEEAIYNQAIVNGIPLCDVPELEPALQRAYKEIEKIESANALDFDIPFDEGWTITVKFVDPNK